MQIHPTFFAEMDRNSRYELGELVNHLVFVTFQKIDT